MRAYTVVLTGATPNTANDLMTFVPASNKPFRVKRVRASGEATASTVMRTVIGRSSGQAGTNPGTTITPDRANGTDALASTTVYSGAFGTTQPSITSHYVEGWNSFGGGFDLVLDGREFVIQANEQLSIRNTVGTGTMNLEVEIEEL